MQIAHWMVQNGTATWAEPKSATIEAVTYPSGSSLDSQPSKRAKTDTTQLGAVDAPLVNLHQQLDNSLLIRILSVPFS